MTPMLGSNVLSRVLCEKLSWNVEVLEGGPMMVFSMESSLAM